MSAAGADFDLGDVAHQSRPVRHDPNLAHGHRADGTAVQHHRRSPGFVFQAAEVAQAAGRGAHRRRHLLRGDAERCTAVRVDPDGQLPRRTAADDRLTDARHRGQPGCDEFLDQVAQGVLVCPAGDLQDHGEAGNGAGIVGLDIEEGVSRLGAGEVGSDPAHLQLAHLQVDAAFEEDREAAAGAADLAPGLGDPRQGPYPGLERQEDLPLDGLRFAARAKEVDVELVAGQGREEFDRQSSPGEQPQDHKPQEEHRYRDGAANGEGVETGSHVTFRFRRRTGRGGAGSVASSRISGRGRAARGASRRWR